MASSQLDPGHLVPTDGPTSTARQPSIILIAGIVAIAVAVVGVASYTVGHQAASGSAGADQRLEISNAGAIISVSKGSARELPVEVRNGSGSHLSFAATLASPDVLNPGQPLRLPAWIDLTSTGVLRAEPTAAEALGAYPVSVTVTSSGKRAEGLFVVWVLDSAEGQGSPDQDEPSTTLATETQAETVVPTSQGEVGAPQYGPGEIRVLRIATLVLAAIAALLAVIILLQQGSIRRTGTPGAGAGGGWFRSWPRHLPAANRATGGKRAVTEEPPGSQGGGGSDTPDGARSGRSEEAWEPAGESPPVRSDSAHNTEPWRPVSSWPLEVPARTQNAPQSILPMVALVDRDGVLEFTATGANMVGEKHVDTETEDSGLLRFVAGKYFCFAIGDGVGGNDHGAEASALAVDAAIRTMAESLSDLPMGESLDLEPLWRQWTDQVISEASRSIIERVVDRQQRGNPCSQPSSTLCWGIVWPCEDEIRCLWSAVGDSGLGIAHQDQTITWLTPGDIRWAGTLSVPTDAVPHPTHQAATGEGSLAPGDALFCGTDGVTQVVHQNESTVAEHLLNVENSLATRCSQLAHRCAEETYDDATIIVIHVARGRRESDLK